MFLVILRVCEWEAMFQSECMFTSTCVWLWLSWCVCASLYLCVRVKHLIHYRVHFICMFATFWPCLVEPVILSVCVCACLSGCVWMCVHAFAFQVMAAQTPTVHPSVPTSPKARSERTLPRERGVCVRACVCFRECACILHRNLCVLCVRELELLFPGQWLSVE